MHKFLAAIPKLPGYYISKDGKAIYSMRGRAAGSFVKLTFRENLNGYLTVALRPAKGEPSKDYTVHRLVCLTFRGDPPTKQHVVDHILGSSTKEKRQDNRACNLRWVTLSENQLNLDPEVHQKRRDSMRDRSIGQTHTQGSNHGRSKLTEDDINNIIALGTEPNAASQKDIAEKYKIDRSLVSKIINKKIWKHVT